MGTYSKSQRTKNHIFQTAKELFLSNGYRSTSLKDIAQAAGVSTGTLYRYFPSKGEILFQIRRNSLDHLHQVAQELPDDMPVVQKICTIIQEDVESISEGFDLKMSPELTGSMLELALATRSESFSTIEQLKEEEQFRQELRSIYAEAIRRAQTAGTFSCDADPDELGQIVSALYFQALDQIMLNPTLSARQLIEPKLTLVFQGFTAS